MNKRLNYIDALKGLAIILVIIGHILIQDYQNMISINIFYFFNHLIVFRYIILFDFICSFHMPLFFIISGFLIHNKFQNSKPKADYKKLLKKFMVPYFVYSIISIVICALTDICLKENYLNNLYNHVFLTIILDGFSSLWFLPSLLLAEIIFYFSENNLNKKEKIGFYTLLIIVTYIFSYFVNFKLWVNAKINLKSTIIFISNIINRSMLGTIFIMIGYISYNYINKITKNIPTLLLSFIIIVLNFFLSQFNKEVDMHYSVVNNVILYYYLAISTSLSLIILFKFLYNKLSIPLEFLGKNSLIILCTHFPFQIIRILTLYIKLNNYFFSKTIIFILTMIIEIVLIFLINSIKKQNKHI